MAESFGKYTLLKRLGGGGMGEVYLSRHQAMGGFDKLCVVKMLLPSLAEDEQFASMFLDEAQLAARLNHPNVCQVFDVGRVDDSLYMAMEHVSGDDLFGLQRTLRDMGVAMPPAFAARIAADAAAGLQHAHKLTDANGRPLDLIHRDISPPNVLVTFEGEVKIIDFGLAKAAGRATQTKDGVLKGKFAYMSPEQVSGEALDHRSDLFALGVVLHELLTGARLFKRQGDMQTLAAVNECLVAPPSKLNSEVPPELDAVVLKALARNRNDRYRDAQAFRFALEEWLRTSREPASNVHVAKFMQQLYKDRIDHEKAKGLLWDAPAGPVSRIRPGKATREPSEHSKPTDVDDRPGPRDDRPADSITRAARPIKPIVEPPTPEGIVLKPRTIALIAALALALAALAAAVAWQLGSSSARQETAEQRR